MKFEYLEAYDHILDFILKSPNIEDIANMKANDAMQEKASELLSKNRNNELDEEEALYLEQISKINYFMATLKARAKKRLNS